MKSMERNISWRQKIRKDHHTSGIYKCEQGMIFGKNQRQNFEMTSMYGSHQPKENNEKD